jgi:hypothetical protein
MSKNQHLRTDVRISPVQYPAVVYMYSDYEEGDHVLVKLEGTMDADEDSTIFFNTDISMTRKQATELATALILALSGAKKDKEDDGYVSFTQDDLEGYEISSSTAPERTINDLVREVEESNL